MNPSLLGERLIWTFALWTIAVQLTTMTSGSLYDALICFSLLALLVLVLTRRRGRRPETPPEQHDPDRDDGRLERAQHILFWTIAVAVVILTGIAHRPDIDDALYINLAVSAADDPGEVLQRYDRQHATGRDVGISRASRLASLRPLAASASWLSGIPAIYFPHMVFSGLAALAVVLANRKLFRILTPRYWAFGVLAVVIVLIADGEVHRTYGNFSFVRLHQGKAVLLSVFVPLLIAQALSFARRPTLRAWLLLAATQIAATGCSSSGLLVAPTVATLGVLTGALGSPRRDRLTLLARSLLSSCYVLALALWSRWPILVTALSSDRALAAGPALKLGVKTQQVVGDDRFMLFQLFVILSAWLWCESRTARRLCLIFPAMVVLLFLNRLTAGVISAYVIPAESYWRVLWIVPLPVMAALTLLAPLTLRGLPLGTRSRYALFFLLLALVPCLLSKRTIVSPHNRVELRVPGLKVPAEYEIAERVVALVEGRVNVLVPETISPWLPTFHHHPYPLLSRRFYAGRVRFPTDVNRRVTLKRYIMGILKKPLPPGVMRRGLTHYQIACVVIQRSNPWRDQIRSALSLNGFEQVEIMLDHEIWLRTAAPS